MRPIPVLLFVLSALVLVGCASLGYQRSTITVDRDATLLDYADFKAEVAATIAVVERDCAEKRIPEATCTRLSAIRDKALAYEARFRAAVRDKKEDLSLQDLRGFIEAGAQIARMAGYPVPPQLLPLLPK